MGVVKGNEFKRFEKIIPGKFWKGCLLKIVKFSAKLDNYFKSYESFCPGVDHSVKVLRMILFGTYQKISALILKMISI